MKFTICKELKLQDEIYDARFHPMRDGLIAAATIGGNVHLINDGEISTTLRRHHKGSPIRRLRFNRDGQLVTVAKTVKLHDLQSGRTSITLKRNDDNKTIFNAVLSLGNSTICAGDDSGSIFVWDTRASGDSFVFSSSDCDQYISDIDGRYEGRRMFVCTSGEGTLTAYDLRTNKMITPQSELFEAGFQCVKMVDKNKQVVVGGEDGAVYIFNNNEWAHTSGKFAVGDDAQNRGKCSIEALDIIPDSSTFLVACSDGRLRSFSLWPHQILSDIAVCKRRSLECLQVNPIEGKSEIIVGGENYLNLVAYDEQSDDESESPSSSDEGIIEAKSDRAKLGDCSEKSRGRSHAEHPRRSSIVDENSAKEIKTNNDDYLNIFN